MTDDSAAVTVEQDGAVCVVTLNRPRALNSINPELRDGLVSALAWAEAQEGIGAVVLLGAGDKAFCAGADLKHVATLDGEDKRRFIESCWSMTERVESSSLPVIAVLHGHVLGGGLELALACDLRLSADDANFALPEIKLGSVPAFGGMQRLARVIGVTAAAEMSMTGRSYSAHEAKEIGLLNDVTTRSDVLDAAMVAAHQVADNSREALRYLKVALRSELNARVAPLFHGLVSETMHRTAAYRASTDAFRNDA